MLKHPATRLAAFYVVSLFLTAPASPVRAQTMDDEAVRPIVNGGEIAAIRGINRESFGLINQRLASLRSQSAEEERELETWWQFFGLTGSHGTRGQVSGYTFESFGLAVGADKALSDSAVVGASFSWGNADINSKGAGDAKSAADSYIVSLYGDYDTGSLYANAALSYGYNKVETAKSWTGGRRTGDYSAGLYSARAELGYAFMRAKTRLIPKLMGHYTHYAPDSYIELGSAAQTVTYDSINALELGAGMDLQWIFANGEGSYWVPEMRLGYRYDVIGDPVSAKTSFVAGGQEFDIQGMDAADGTLGFGLGLTYYSKQAWELVLRYDLAAKQDYTGHAGMVRAAYKFY